jgi:branched-chain amino acid transport system substrate-binding protein
MTDIKLNRRTLVAGGAATVATATPLRYARAAAPVKVGILLPTSGVLAAPGQASLRGINFALKILNERGGQAYEFQYFDLESKPENGRVGAEKLIRDGCSVLIGCWDTGATISAAQACEAAKVPMVINISSGPQVTEQGFTQIFRNFTPSGVLIRNAVARLKEIVAGKGAAAKTAVVLHVNDTFGQGALGALNSLWGQLDVPIKIVDQIGYDLRAKDLSIEVGKAKATGADILMPITRVNDAIMIVREMVKQAYNPMAIFGPGSPGPYEKAFTDAVGKYGDDYMDSVPWYNPKKAETKTIVARYEKENPNDRFELNVGFSYEAVQIVDDAVRRANSADPQAIHAALKTTNIADHIMYGGPIQFDAKGQNNNVGGVMLQNQGGKPLVVGPAEIAEADVIFPLKPFAQR